MCVDGEFPSEVPIYMFGENGENTEETIEVVFYTHQQSVIGVYHLAIGRGDAKIHQSWIPIGKVHFNVE